MKGLRALWDSRAKFARLIGALFIVTFFTTAMAGLSGRSPAELVLGDQATDEQIAAFNAEHGYDEPLFTRYWDWLTSALTGDLGTSVVTNVPVIDTIGQRVAVTVELSLIVIVLSVVLSVILAIVTANRAGGWLDRVLSIGNGGLLSLPSFAIAVILIYFLAVSTQLLPPAGWVPWDRSPENHLRSLVLPVLTLLLVEVPALTMVLRSDLIRTLNDDFILTARSKGLSRGYILIRHALRPSISGFLALTGVTLGRLLGGVVIVESVFALPGIGQLTVQSVLANDLPIVQGIVVIVAVIYVVINGALDATFAYIDPRTRAPGK